MRTTTAYLILSLTGSSNSSKTTGTGEGELGMTAGTPSLQDKGVSNTNHAALLVLGIAADGHDVYISLYPHGGGIFSTGRFRSTRSDGLFRAEYAKTIYRIEGLDELSMQAYLMQLNAGVQAGCLRELLRTRIRNPDLADDDRARYTAELAALPPILGYNAIRHNCTTVVVKALRAGGFAVPPVLFLETPTWLNRIAERAPGIYHRESFGDFQTAMRGRDIERPHAAFPFEPMMRLNRALGLEPVPPVERPGLAVAGGAGVSVPVVAGEEIVMSDNPMMSRPAVGAANARSPAALGDASHPVINVAVCSAGVLLESAAPSSSTQAAAAGVGVVGGTGFATGSPVVSRAESKDDKKLSDGGGVAPGR